MNKNKQTHVTEHVSDNMIENKLEPYTKPESTSIGFVLESTILVGSGTNSTSTVVDYEDGDDYQ